MFPEQFHRLRPWLRPISLIVIQQGLWPLLVLLGSGPRVTEPENLPWDWWAVRVLAPAIAAVVAWIYTGGLPRDPAAEQSRGQLKLQMRFALIGLPVMVAIVRLIAGPAGEATKIAGYGAVEALALQLVSFGVARRLFAGDRRGDLAAIVTFALSWATRDVILSVIGDSDGQIVFTAIGGLVAGGLIALAVLAVRRWPGGFWPAWGAQWLVITLIIGFS